MIDEKLRTEAVVAVSPLTAPELTESKRRRGSGVASLSVLLAVLLSLAGIGAIHRFRNAASSVGQPLSEGLNVSAPVSAKVIISTVFSGAGAPAASVRGQGLYDFTRGRGSFVMSVPGIGPTPVVVNANDVYVQQPVARSDGQFAWTKLDRNVMSSTTRVSVGFLDPATVLSYLDAATSSSAVKVSDESSATGGMLSHYQAKLDMTSGSAVGQSIRKVAVAAGLNSLPIDVWLDGSDRVRKVTFAIDLAKLTLPKSPLPGFAGLISYSMEFNDFGTPVDVQVPDVSALTSTAVVAP